MVEDQLRFAWPRDQRCAFVLSFDFDAESGIYFRDPKRAERSLAAMEERRYGPRVGVERILKLLDRYGLRVTFFIPAWTVENYPRQCQAIRDAGHEIGAHGYVHESVEELSREDEEAVMRESLAVLKTNLGVTPAGFRAPYFAMNLWTPEVLRRHGFIYDSSLWGNDIPYVLETTAGELIELPVQSMLDDLPYYRHVSTASNDIADSDRVLRIYQQEFASFYEEAGCFVLTQHPYIVGRPSRLAALEEMIRYVRGFDNVWFATGQEVAEWSLSGGRQYCPIVGRRETDQRPMTHVRKQFSD